MKVNYLKEWGEDGTVYSQTITIEKKYIEKFNELVRAKREEISKKFIISGEEMKILSYLQELQEGKNYTYLTTLDFFMKFYLKYIYEPPKKDKNYERILHRNTIINVI